MQSRVDPVFVRHIPRNASACLHWKFARAKARGSDLVTNPQVQVWHNTGGSSLGLALGQLSVSRARHQQTGSASVSGMRLARTVPARLSVYRMNPGARLKQPAPDVSDHCYIGLARGMRMSLLYRQRGNSAILPLHVTRSPE